MPTLPCHSHPHQICAAMQQAWEQEEHGRSITASQASQHHTHVDMLTTSAPSGEFSGTLCAVGDRNTGASFASVRMTWDAMSRQRQHNQRHVQRKLPAPWMFTVRINTVVTGGMLVVAPSSRMVKFRKYVCGPNS